MQAPSGHTTTPPVHALLADGALAGQWALDPGQSRVQLKSGVLGGLIRVNGVFRDVSGNGTVSPAGQVSGTLTVAAASVDTKKAKRDAHLCSADFFDTANHPDITATVHGIRPSGQDADVTGTLTVRDRTQPLSFTAGLAVHGGRAPKRRQSDCRDDGENRRDDPWKGFCARNRQGSLLGHGKIQSRS